jgi:hypothetical protein
VFVCLCVCVFVCLCVCVFVRERERARLTMRVSFIGGQERKRMCDGDLEIEADRERE